MVEVSEFTRNDALGWYWDLIFAGNDLLSGSIISDNPWGSDYDFEGFNFMQEWKSEIRSVILG